MNIMYVTEFFKTLLIFAFLPVCIVKMFVTGNNV